MALTSNRMRIGLSNVVYSIMDDTTDVTAGVISYGTVYPLVGAMTLSFDRGASVATVFGDDGPFAVGDTVGEMKLTLEIADILPADYARLLGFTYANGLIAEGVSDQSPYVAIGFKTLRMGVDGANKVYEYFWLPKVKFQKPKNDEKTKDKSLAPRTVSLEGVALMTTSNSKYIVRARGDDPAVASATITGWFATPIYNPSVDLNAFTFTSAAGTISTKTFRLTFAKAGGGTTVVGNASAANIVIAPASTGVPIVLTTFTPGSASTTPYVDVVTSATLTGVSYIVTAMGSLVDANGAPCVLKGVTCTPA